MGVFWVTRVSLYELHSLICLAENLFSSFFYRVFNGCSAGVLAGINVFHMHFL